MTGKEKVTLETYVQMQDLDAVLACANTRFMVMSGGQYELVRRQTAENNRNQSGLDLDVIDHYNGTTRSVKSLSGGESFKASLSLALGLSDRVQSAAGGVRLDAMFVDEGFGSLDEESLHQALHALTDLARSDRLVGIISHVADLRAAIDRQILVTKLPPAAATPPSYNGIQIQNTPARRAAVQGCSCFLVIVWRLSQCSPWRLGCEDSDIGQTLEHHFGQERCVVAHVHIALGVGDQLGLAAPWAERKQKVIISRWARSSPVRV